MAEHRHRIATWWFHWPDLMWPDSDNLDRIKARAEGYAKANVTAAMLFGAHFRWDFLPVFPLLHDYIATVTEELHKYGIKVFDHHSCNLVHRYSTREEMRHVMVDSGPHLPFSPTFEAAADWTWKGKKLNDWRMIDVKNGKPLWFPQYTAEGFCHRNPEYAEAYRDYAKYLISETGIDGLSADDAIYYMHHNACGCEHCRAELRRRAGIELPPADDQSFWGNWENPAWRHWLDLRFDASGDFYGALRKVLPEGFMLTGCGAASASAAAVMSATDARHFLQGWDYVNMELSGNTPPYKKDKLTVNVPIPDRLVNSSHHQAVAREGGVRAFCTGFAHSKLAADHVWATAKVLDADAWIGTLKTRLGLPWHILNTIPSEEDIVGEAFTFEKEHEELFRGTPAGQLGVYFSYETRNHTCFGAMVKGYYQDYSRTLRLLFGDGICPHTVFSFPTSAEQYPVIILPSVAQMTDAERAAMDVYLASGGKVIAFGPTDLPGCKHSWVLPTRVDCAPEDFFTTVPDGIHPKTPEWISKMTVPATADAAAWQQPRENVFYHPHRLGGELDGELLSKVRGMIKPLPVTFTHVEGYLVTTLQGEAGTTVQLLAADYDVDINHELDSIRNHRSRVNLLTTILPAGTDDTVTFQTEKTPEVFTPFCQGTATLEQDGSNWTLRLPKDCTYALLHLA